MNNKETITTNSGKVFICNFFGVTSGSDNVQIVISESSIPDVLCTFMDTNETRKLIYMDGTEGAGEVYDYVIINTIVPGNDYIRVSLRRPYIGELPDYIPYGGLEDEQK